MSIKMWIALVFDCDIYILIGGYFELGRKKTDQLLIRLTPGIKKALAIAADKDSRSMASLIEKLIKDYLEREGILWNKPD